MKKFILLMLLMLGSVTATFAETQWYRTTSFAFAYVRNGVYTWGKWESSNMNISINLDTDVITVYSPTTQRYDVYGSYNNGRTYSDNKGGTNIKFYVIDQDYDRGEIRLRVERNGNSQIYIDFNDCAWVYNVKRIR